MAYEAWSLTIGVIVAPFGLAGEVKVRLETDFPERFTRLTQVCLRPPDGEARLCSVENTRPHKGQILLRLRGVASIDDAERLRNVLVQVRPEDAVPLPPNEFYIYDLVGCEVVSVDGVRLGTLTSVIRGTGNDAYVIDGGARGEILLPAIHEVIRSVDLSTRRITVSPTPGLLPGQAEEA
jgi:16S rRNA processing protein RimM